jgi:NAD(P)-dependent dehydrogenase (short-subunit alcohol dehydrogenase family)
VGRLSGRSALITGGNSGIGLATAEAFVREGARVAITGRNPATLTAASELLGGDVVAMEVDVQRLDDLDRLFLEIAKQFGSLDIVFANAGVGTPCALEDFTEELFDEIYDVNVKGAFFTVQKALPLLNEGAAIILNASIAQYTGVPGFSAYGSSKAAVRALGRLFAADLVGRNIRVNVVTPGPIRTPIWERLPGGRSTAEEHEKRLVQRVPMARMGEASEVAEAVLFLASDASSYMTGGELIVDGGIVDLPAAAR